MIGYPNATSYVGCIGNDEFGKILREVAEQDGVNVQYFLDPTADTGTCAVLVKDKEMSMKCPSLMQKELFHN